MTPSALELNDLKNKYRALFNNLEREPDSDAIERALMEIRDAIAGLKALDIKELRASLRKATQTSIAVLMNFEGKIRNLRKQGAGVSSSLVSSNLQPENKIEWVDLENAFEHRINTGMILNIGHKNLDNFLSDAKKELVEKIQNILQRKNAIKINTTLALDFAIKKSDSIEIESKYFSDGSMEILQSTNLNQVITENLNTLKRDQEESAMRGSGWTLHEILHLEVHMYDYIPLQGGNSFVRMPQWIIHTKSVINVQNTDEFCFIWSVLAALHPHEKNPCRVTSYYKYHNELNTNGITFPISWEGIGVFEKLNNLKINIYGIEKELNPEDEGCNNSNADDMLDGATLAHNEVGGNEAVEEKKKKAKRGRIVPLYLSENICEPKTIHLLMISNVDENDDKEDVDVELSLA